MNSLLNPAEAQTYVSRINSLTPQSSAQWGKMNVSQMLAHCSCSFETALGDIREKRALIGYIFGQMGKKELMGPKPVRKNMPTAKSFIKIDQQCDFTTEKAKLLALLERYTQSGEAAIGQYPHAFFGMMTAQEWDHLTSKHLDHHLQQFGV